jgi:hypothetical protein
MTKVYNRGDWLLRIEHDVLGKLCLKSRDNPVMGRAIAPAGWCGSAKISDAKLEIAGAE